MKRRNDSHSSSSVDGSSVRTRTMPVQCGTTRIVDLVDDCLFEIYKHLDLTDLASIADACLRFRSTSQTFFVQSGYGVLHYPSSIFTREELKRDRLDQLMMRTSNVLRNFGAFVTTFDESHGMSPLNITKSERRSYAKKIVKLLQRYCTDSLIVLKFVGLRFVSEMTKIRKPMFPKLQIFEMKGCIYGTNALLSIWLPEMREITIGTEMVVRRATMRKHFENLTKATLAGMWCNNSIRRFLMPNPQLRELNAFGIGSNSMDFRVLEYIGKYTKDIEVVRLSMRMVKARVEYPSTINYFSDLKKLKCFELREIDYPYSKGAEILRSIVSAEISLKSLTVDSVGGPKTMRVDLVLEEVLQLKSLEVLDLGVVLSSKEYIIRICTQLDRLCELRVDFPGILNMDDLIHIVRVATKLQWLHPRGNLNFDANLLEQLKAALRTHSEHSQFVLRISEKHRTMSLSSDWSQQLVVENPPISVCSRVWELEVCTHTNFGLGKCRRQHAALTEFPVRSKNNDLLEKEDKRRRILGRVPLSKEQLPAFM